MMLDGRYYDGRDDKAILRDMRQLVINMRGGMIQLTRLFNQISDWMGEWSVSDMELRQRDMDHWEQYQGPTSRPLPPQEQQQQPGRMKVFRGHTGQSGEEAK